VYRGDSIKENRRSLEMTGQEAKVTTRKGKKRPKTAAEKQFNLVDRLMDKVNRIHKRV
jgi:hypothetical protein